MIGLNIFVSMIIDIACYKYRYLAQVLMYMEGLMTGFTVLIPVKSYMEMSVFT